MLVDFSFGMMVGILTESTLGDDGGHLNGIHTGRLTEGCGVEGIVLMTSKTVCMYACLCTCALFVHVCFVVCSLLLQLFLMPFLDEKALP